MAKIVRLSEYDAHRALLQRTRAAQPTPKPCAPRVPRPGHLSPGESLIALFALLSLSAGFCLIAIGALLQMDALISAGLPPLLAGIGGVVILVLASDRGGRS